MSRAEWRGRIVAGELSGANCRGREIKGEMSRAEWPMRLANGGWRMVDGGWWSRAVGNRDSSCGEEKPRRREYIAGESRYIQSKSESSREIRTAAGTSTHPDSVDALEVALVGQFPKTPMAINQTGLVENALLRSGQSRLTRPELIWILVYGINMAR